MLLVSPLISYTRTINLSIIIMPNMVVSQYIYQLMVDVITEAKVVVLLIDLSISFMRNEITDHVQNVIVDIVIYLNGIKNI